MSAAEPICLPCHLAAVHDEPLTTHGCVGRLVFLAEREEDIVSTHCQCDCQRERQGSQ